MSFATPLLRNLRQIRPTVQRACIRPAYQKPVMPMVRFMASKSKADLVIEEITELYATARDEFEIAMEETEKTSVYAEDDRQAAKEELEKVQAAYKNIIDGSDKELADEVSKRIGQRIRELENGVKRMEEIAQEHD